jgi:hypothetical protein
VPQIPLPPEYSSVPPETYKAVTDAYYGELVKAPAGARSRAQAAYAIAAAIATALVTAGVLTDFKEQDDVVKVGGLLAIAAWMATALIYMLAVGVGVKPLHSDEHLDSDKFVNAVAGNVKNEVDRVNNSIKSGWICALVAAGLTLGTFVLAFFISKPVNVDEVKATITLTPRGRSNVAKLCKSKRGKQLVGLLDQNTLEKARAKVRLGSSGCPAAADLPGAKMILHVPTKQILAYSHKAPNP